MPQEYITFAVKPTAQLRCPMFADADQQAFWCGLWRLRLRIFKRLFPWLNDSIRQLVGLPSDATIGGGDHDANVEYLAAHDEYAKGYRSDHAQVRAMHDRQNAEWTSLTNLPPLGSIEDWRAAAAAAGVPPANFDARNLQQIADCVLAWALARRSAQTAAFAQRQIYIHTKGGTVNMGDKITINGNVTGSAVGSDAAVNARDITAYNQTVETNVADGDLRSVLKQAREELERAGLSETDKDDAADELGKITEELQRPQPNGNRIQRAWAAIQCIAPTVAAILASAEIIRQWLQE